MVRLKHRYLLVNILYPEPSPTSKQPNPILSIHRPTPDTLTPALLSKLIRDTISLLFGDFGVGKLGGATAGRVGVKYLSPATSTAIIRCPRSGYRLVCAALAMLGGVPLTGKEGNYAALLGGDADEKIRPCVFQVVRVSGTIKKVEQEAIRRARRDVVRLMAVEGAATGTTNVGPGGNADLLDQILGTTKGKDDDDVVMGVDADDDEDDGEGESDDE